MQYTFIMLKRRILCISMVDTTSHEAELCTLITSKHKCSQHSYVEFAFHTGFVLPSCFYISTACAQLMYDLEIVLINNLTN